MCIFPQFIVTAKQHLPSDIAIATVANFPDGSHHIDNAVHETKQAIALGAHEVDVVFPYRALLMGDEDVGYQLIKQCKYVCGDNVRLKVIIESGELKTDAMIEQASRIAISAGADFLKTSTGKVSVNATISVAELMLNTIKKSGRHVGFKAAGGVRTVTEAKHYIELAMEIMGVNWVNAENFRFGASGLLNDVLNTLKIDTRSVLQQGDY